MTLPPFPSQDLAKLVLGYLAEEQLMTAYDEFLQASPYLDALGNEYDRIFMTSLKNILAEYRAVKIYVETCKPFILRKRIFQCGNLLEMVKFLIQNVDIHKLQVQENLYMAKSSLEKHVNLTSVKTNKCDVCCSLKLDSCTCKSKSNVSSVPSNTHTSTSSVENSIETTSLSDLPGNHVTCRKKPARVSNKDLSEPYNIDLNESSIKSVINDLDVVQKAVSNNSNDNFPPTKVYPEFSQDISITEKPDSIEMRQKEEFNNILSQVCNKNNHVDINFSKIDKQTKASTSGYEDFATGVKSGGNGANVSVPDSSTSENLLVQIPAAKDSSKLINLEKNAKLVQTKTQYLLKVASVKNNVTVQPNEVVSISTVNTSTYPRIKAKADESKIKILSDVIVDKPFNTSEACVSSMPKMPPVLKNATSTPLLQMQTIVINGTPVYKHKPYGPTQNYTKDEIMAMPTIILAPVQGPSQGSVNQPTQNLPVITTSSSSLPLGPLALDVTSSNNSYADNITKVSKENEQKISPAKEAKLETKDGIITKTVDITSASAPKDNTVTGATETSTPQVLPPVRKSSSTPRRTSHIRVLDFTTPRRILHETMNKCVPHMTLDSDKEVVLSKSPNIPPISLNIQNVTEKNKLDEGNTRPLKENTAKKISKNWDADLRLLATVPERDITVDVQSPKVKPKPKPARKSKPPKSHVTKKVDKPEDEKVSNNKKTAKVKLPKNKPVEAVEIITIPDEKGDTPVKPTINIISGVDRNQNTSTEINKPQNKSNNEDHIDTPEMERISLQNEIGAKLNISDLLETPYKQALYDIQMETPRFLGPDIPDDPMSDIKIMNIPTPRFLNTAATPSSYSSRPTDYSSGGSYYKPEDQDYMRIHEELDCPVTSTRENIPNDVSSNKDSDDSKEKENLKPTRPVRECTKNVSYNLATMSTRSKNTENRSDMDSSVDSTVERASEKISSNIPITPKIKENKPRNDTIKKGSSKKRRTPVKKETVKSFMKIKPRRPTPTKNNVRGKRKSTDPATLSKVQTRKKATNKEGSVSNTPIVNAAPTKSRRKSSTPRKLHCSKSFHSDSSGHDSPELVPKNKENVPEAVNIQDSDTEQLPLQWSDDGSQEPQPVVISIPNDTEDIKKIREYIETNTQPIQRVEKGSSLHIDLVKRGFDLETAKIIERDLLDTPPPIRQDNTDQEKLTLSTPIETVNVIVPESKIDNAVLEKILESDSSAPNNLQIVQSDEEETEEEIELSVHECNEDSTNYITCNHDESTNTPKSELPKLKDKFSMEVCIDDGVSIRLRATPFSLLLDQDPLTVEYFNYSYRETEMAVSSISNYDKLYTPLKESIKAQCYEIFDSTLTSLDTPLKVRSPKKTETNVSVTDIVLEVEKVNEKEKLETKKRKRVQSGNVSDEGVTESKRAKPEAQLLSNIQNFDIDSVLSKLHGP